MDSPVVTKKDTRRLYSLKAPTDPEWFATYQAIRRDIHPLFHT